MSGSAAALPGSKPRGQCVGILNNARANPKINGLLGVDPKMELSQFFQGPKNEYIAEK